MLDSVIRVNKKYYPQTLLEEWKYEMKKNKMENLIIMILSQAHLMNLIMNLIVSLIVSLIMNLIMMNLMINLKIKTAF